MRQRAPLAPDGATRPLRGETDSERFTLPARSYPSDAGLDLFSTTHVVIAPHTTARIPHNFALALPPKTYGLIVPRSSTLQTKGLLVVTGTIDPGFRGEVQTVVWNLSTHTVHVASGERLSQLLLLPWYPVLAEEAKVLPASDRGEQGFGSTGGFQNRRG